MVYDVAESAETADPGAGISALQVDAGQAGGALAVDDALGAAGGRGAVVAWVAGADWPLLQYPAVRVGSTRRGLAWVHWLRCVDGSCRP